MGNYNEVLAILKSAILTRLKIAHVPPSSLFAKCCLMYLKYKCSKSKKTAARRIPIISKRNALKNCSNAKGSLLFCTSFPGLHVPVIQYLLNLSRSPANWWSRKIVMNLSSKVLCRSIYFRKMESSLLLDEDIL